MATRLGRQTLMLNSPVGIISSAAVGGKKEAQGPLKHCFDILSEDSYFAQPSWEKAEIEMLRLSMQRCLDKARPILPSPSVSPAATC